MTMTIGVAEVSHAIAPLVNAMNSDGYDVEVDRADFEQVTLRILARPNSCSDCLVPEAVLRLQFQACLSPVLRGRTLELVYPERAAE